MGESQGDSEGSGRSQKWRKLRVRVPWCFGRTLSYRSVIWTSRLGLGGGAGLSICCYQIFLKGNRQIYQQISAVYNANTDEFKDFPSCFFCKVHQTKYFVINRHKGYFLNGLLYSAQIIIESIRIAITQAHSMKQSLPSPKSKPKWINPLRDRTRVIPFVVPSEQQRMSALGSLAGEKWRLRKALQAIIPEFQPIKKPQPGDNLYQFEQEGQSYPLFASKPRNHIDTSTEVIYIATFHCKLDEGQLKKFKKAAKAFFHGVKVKLHAFPHNVDLQKFSPVLSPKGDTYYNAAELNTHFARKLPPKCYSVAILTDLLLYNGDNPHQQLLQRWVFGLGSLKDRCSIISYSEIVKQGYDNPLTPQLLTHQYTQPLHLQFLHKVIHHQLCHTFGMRHCIYYTCLMNGTNHYKQAVQKVPHLCPICVRKLQHAIGFDYADRYEDLGDEKSVRLAEMVRGVVEGGGSRR